MAIRNIRKEEDPILKKKAKEVTKITDRELTLIEDMIETMYDADGVGLAAPQVGILKRMAVIDIGEGPIVIINPKIVESTGEEVEYEGCLSLPGVSGKVPRPTFVKVMALNMDGEEVTIEAEGFFARAMCHEIDHLDGILFMDKAVDIEMDE